MALRNVVCPAPIGACDVVTLVVLTPGEVKVHSVRRGKAGLLVGCVDDPGSAEARLVTVCSQSGGKGEESRVRDVRGCVVADTECFKVMGKEWGWHWTY